MGRKSTSPVFTPKILDDTSLKEFQSLKPDVAILFAYGKIVPLNWLNTPLNGFINIHASLLPRWRGQRLFKELLKIMIKKQALV